MPQLIAAMIAILLVQDAPVRYGPGITPPKLIHSVDAEYSEEARRAKLQGTVDVLMVLGVDGVPSEATVTKGLGLGLDEKAIEAVKQFRFEPGRKDGVAVRMVAPLEIDFRLLDAPWIVNKMDFGTSQDMTRPVLMHAEFPSERPSSTSALGLVFTIGEQGVPVFVGDPASVIPGGIVDAVTRWRFTPAMKNGVATAVRLDLEFSIVPSRTPPSAFNAGAGVSMPQLISKVEPTYSPEALKAKLIGSESLQVIVGVDGSPRNFRVMKGLGLGLDEAAIEAVKQWRFQPGSKDGKAVPVFAQVEVSFNLLKSGPWQLSKAVFGTPPGATRPVLTQTEFPKGKPKGHGTIAMTFTIDEHGQPRNLAVDKPDSDLASEIIAAVKKWRFDPATKDGAPIAVQATFDFTALRVM